ncbi:DUF3995 domain-containing protein [Thermomonospora umbrina]|uniref:Uncharacterized protein DUF3995 n=1 Tax=Thermomonospora umbrina TaxID=111806 RepID=A0A3D9T690_9ACTN|nr:DUF3995 domain-containing protein [Thermomonospora umbrina]REF00766.1 uncharacterized protein DUF3995 [Thermomonospora umbrina]
MPLAKLAGGAAMLGLGAAAAMHTVWIFSPWPFEDLAEFTRTIAGVPEAEAPSAAATGSVAVALGTAAYLVAAQANLAPRLLPTRLERLGTATVAGVLLLRGCAGLASSGFADESTTFTRWDLALYSPLCLTLGALAAYVAKTEETTRAGQKDARAADG